MSEHIGMYIDRQHYLSLPEIFGYMEIKEQVKQLRPNLEEEAEKGLGQWLDMMDPEDRCIDQAKLLKAYTKRVNEVDEKVLEDLGFKDLPVEKWRHSFLATIGKDEEVNEQTELWICVWQKKASV